MNAAYFIQHLHLQPHPEGGYFRETYRASEFIKVDALPPRFSGVRPFSTAIYYLLQQGDFSAFHRIQSDECWHFYAGDTLLIHVIEEDGKYCCIQLGSNVAAGEMFQFVVPATAWFAAGPASNNAFTLAGCTVAPGFDFSDFEIADRNTLLDTYPQHADIINRLTRQ
ncbi:cupin domain-containing protein [Ilyomonas limi]|uniref:Cupin domain-containing protein n=1 Tax=Ilyomonas limi TaxID=2575867 RepID=A0A4U3LBT4_9BACT|nr:cupin domain-containing protein [Ilyomonas limi]TKK71506.1 cupin domain-containing protein [Ilyomonas limi]